MPTPIRKILKLPLVILRDLLTFIPIYDRLNVMRWICILTDDVDDILQYITALVLTYGPKDYEQPALEQMQIHKDARFAQILAQAYYQKKQYSDARRIIHSAMTEECKNDFVLLMLRFMLYREGDADSKQTIAEKILQRDDLPPDASRIAWSFKCWNLIESGQIQDAEKAADRILEIEENDAAMLAKWVATFNSDQDKAKAYFLRANQIWKNNHFEAAAAQGWYVLGQTKQAAEYLKRAIQRGFVPPKDDAIFEKIMKSTEYQV